MSPMVETLKEIVAVWPHVSLHPHQFQATEFRFGSAEVGHIHSGGALDIPFPRAIRDHLIAIRAAQLHRWEPNSGWTTFELQSEDDLVPTLRLLRVSWLRYALKIDRNPMALLEYEAQEWRIRPEVAALLMPFIPAQSARIQ